MLSACEIFRSSLVYDSRSTVSTMSVAGGNSNFLLSTQVFIHVATLYITLNDQSNCSDVNSCDFLNFVFAY